MNSDEPPFPYPLGTRIPEGTVLSLGPDAGVQWRIAPIRFFLVVAELDWKTSWYGTVYLDGYELNRAGKAVARRTVYVIKAGLKLVRTEAQTKPPPTIMKSRRRQRADAQAVRTAA